MKKQQPQHFVIFAIVAVLSAIFCCSATSVNAETTGISSTFAQSQSGKASGRATPVATVDEKHSSQYHGIASLFGAMAKNHNEEVILWRFPNMCPELSQATTELMETLKRNKTSAAERQDPLASCRELALRVTWLLWWNLNERTTKKQQNYWRQFLLWNNHLLDKIQPKNAKSLNACISGVREFVFWQLDDIGQGKLAALDKESEQFLRQIHQKLNYFMAKSFKPFSVMEVLHQFLENFQQMFQIYVERIDKYRSYGAMAKNDYDVHNTISTASSSTTTIKRHSVPPQHDNMMKIKFVNDDNAQTRLESSPATTEQQASSKYEVEVGVKANNYYNDEEEIYWRFPNVCPELCNATKDLFVSAAAEKQSPLARCKELTLRVTWLFWWNLNERATKKEQTDWRQELLRNNDLLDKIQPKMAKNFNTCMKGLQKFMGWHLEQAKKGNLIIDGESAEFLHQTHQKLTDLIQNGLPHKPLSAVENSHQFFQNVEQSFMEKFQFYVELMNTSVLAIDKKQQQKVELMKDMADRMENEKWQLRNQLRSGILFDAKHIRDQAREILKMLELEQCQKSAAIYGDKNILPPPVDLVNIDTMKTADEKALMVKNLCETLVKEFVARWEEESDYLWLKRENQFVRHAQEWCNEMQKNTDETQTGSMLKRKGRLIELQKDWQKLRIETMSSMLKFPEITLFFQLEMIDQELQELALEIHRIGVRIFSRWEAGAKATNLTSTTTRLFAMRTAAEEEEEEELKVVRQLFSNFLGIMSELGLNLYVNMEGRISRHQLESLGKRKPENSDNLYWEEALALSRLIISSYNEMELFSKAELRICFAVNGPIDNYEVGHFFLSVGNIEYHYTDLGLGRRRFLNDWKNIEWEGQSGYEKTEPIVGMEFVEVAKADKLFYELVEEGFWSGQGLRKNMRNCHTFVYLFVCRLFKGTCPEPDQWPYDFVHWPGRPVHVGPEFNVFQPGFYQRISDASSAEQHVQMEPSNCQLQDVEFKFKLETGMYKTKLPPILVRYTAGKMWNEAKQKIVERYGGTFFNQSDAECIENVESKTVGVDNRFVAGLSTCRTTIKVFVCAELVGNDNDAKGKRLQQQQQPILLTEVIFYKLKQSGDYIDPICRIEMIDLSFHNSNKPDSMPIVDLDESSCGGAGTDVKSPIEKLHIPKQQTKNTN